MESSYLRLGSESLHTLCGRQAPCVSITYLDRNVIMLEGEKHMLVNISVGKSLEMSLKSVLESLSTFELVCALILEGAHGNSSCGIS